MTNPPTSNRQPMALVLQYVRTSLSARINAILLACWLSPAICLADETSRGQCTLTIKLIDSETGETLPGIVRATTLDGKDVAIASLLNRGQGVEDAGPIHNWWVLPEPRAARLPSVPLAIHAVSGLDSELAKKNIDLTGQTEAQLQIPLKRFGQLTRRLYRSGNTHVHLRKLTSAQADRYLREVPRVDGLDIVFVSHLERASADLEYTSNRYTPDDLTRLSNDHVRFGYGEEHRHNFGSYGEGYGHVLLLDIPRTVQPVSIGPGITQRGSDAPPLQAGIDETHRLRGKAVWAHNRLGFEDIPNWITGRLDANNVYDGNQHGSYEDPYYRYLNVGLRAPLCTGTDWFIYDFSRTYVLADADVTPTEWLAGAAAGKSFVTNGPLLEVEVQGHKPGSEVKLAAPQVVTIKGRCLGRTDFGRIELVQNGRVVRAAASLPADGHFVAELQLELLIDKSCWLAMRTPERPAHNEPQQASFPKNEFGAGLFAHTSPLYVRLSGQDVFDTNTAAALVDELKADRDGINSRAKFDDDGQRQSVMRVYQQAIDALEQRIRNKGGGPKAD